MRPIVEDESQFPIIYIYVMLVLSIVALFLMISSKEVVSPPRTVSGLTLEECNKLGGSFSPSYTSHVYVITQHNSSSCTFR